MNDVDRFFDSLADGIATVFHIIANIPKLIYGGVIAYVMVHVMWEIRPLIWGARRQLWESLFDAVRQLGQVG